MTAVNPASCEAASPQRPTVLSLLGTFAVVLIVGALLDRIGLFNSAISLGSSVSFLSAFVIGLVAAGSTCMAVSGGLLLSTAAKFRERFGHTGTAQRMAPVVLFVFGRLVSYAIFGALIGTLGKALTPSPVFYGIVTVFAAAVMLALGLDMLHLLPAWAKKLMPRMPMSLARRIMDKEGSVHPVAPFALGAATFFLPCGFTQALQIYALSTGSGAAGALVLFAFALGTVPVLLALGWASRSFSGRASRIFFRFAGVAVIMLGLTNIQFGLTIIGYPIPTPHFAPAGADAPASGAGFGGSVQTIRMSAGRYGYSPAAFTVRAGVPTRWEIDGTDAAGCATVLISRQLSIQKLLARGANVIEFSIPTPGTYAFSCSMGMYRGTITAVGS